MILIILIITIIMIIMIFLYIVIIQSFINLDSQINYILLWLKGLAKEL